MKIGLFIFLFHLTTFSSIQNNIEHVVLEEKAFVGKPLTVIYFSCETCELSLISKTTSSFEEIQQGLFVLKKEKTVRQIAGDNRNCFEISFISFVSGKLELPPFHFAVYKSETIDNSISTSTEQISSKPIPIKFTSQLKNLNWAPFLGKYAIIDKKKIILYFLASILTLFFILVVLFFLRKIFKTEKKPAPKIILTKELIITRLLALQEDCENKQLAFQELSNLFKSWMELEFTIPAKHLINKHIYYRLHDKCSQKILSKILRILEKLNFLRFSGEKLSKPLLLQHINKIKEIIDEF